MRKQVCRLMWGLLIGAGLGLSSNAQSPAQTTASGQTSGQTARVGTAAQTPKATRRRYTRRGAAGRSGARTASGTSSGATTQVGPTDEQRRRDQLILAVQKQQSAETARQNAVVTGNVQKERDAQQAEPRIQDAPGPGSAPLAGEPAVAPGSAGQSPDAPRIQDAPGPAQTLPQTPPAPPAPQTTQPAPQR